MVHAGHVEHVGVREQPPATARGDLADQEVAECSRGHGVGQRPRDQSHPRVREDRCRVEVEATFEVEDFLRNAGR